MADFRGTEVSRPVSRLVWPQVVAIGGAALAVEIPFFFFGTPSGHDVEFHLYSWLEVLSQWKHGIFLPRWAALAHFDYGEPRFLFYPPASWTLGALLSALLPWSIVAGVYIWLALTLSGASMFVLARRWLSHNDAIFAAIFYVANPYHLVIVYWRSAFAELLASCLLPLLLLLVVRAADREHNVWVPLSLVLAAAWLTNAPSAVMIHYSLALLAILFAWQQRSTRVILVASVAVAVGACLAAFYLLPAIYEQRWINIAEAVSAGSRPQDNFLFIHTADAEHDAFNRLVSWVALLEMVVTFLAIWTAREWRATKRALWTSVAGWAAACAVLMFPFTAWLWKYLPKLEFMQFPWRWLLCLSLMLTIFVAVAMQRWWMRALVYIVALIVVAGAWHFIQPPWWDNAADLREMRDNIADGTGYEGTDEYAPLGSDPTSLAKDAPDVTVDDGAKAAIKILQWDAESKEFTAEMSAPDRLALRLLRYPAWRVRVNGALVETTMRPENGQMLVPVLAGMNRVQVTFIRTWDRTLGGWISVATAWCLILWIVLARNRKLSAR